MRLYGSKDAINIFFIEHTRKTSFFKLFKSIVYLDAVMPFQPFDDFAHGLVLKNKDSLGP